MYMYVHVRRSAASYHKEKVAKVPFLQIVKAMSEEETTLTPSVLWAQRKHLVLMRVQVQPIGRPDFTIHEDYMTFKCEGVGMSGHGTFTFKLTFFEPVKSDTCRVKFSEKEIEFRLLKKQETTWPRLQSSLEKPHWISVDFERFEYQDDSEPEAEEEGEEEQGEIMDPEKLKRMEETRAQLKEFEDVAMKQVARYNKIVDFLNKLRVVYLLAYNGIMWSGFILIVLTLLRLPAKGMEGITSAYEKVSPMMIFCQGLMLLEIVHAAVGLVKGGVFPIFLQVFGRFLILFAILIPAEEIHDHPIVFALFLLWSSIELFRYPYYALSVIHLDIKTLTWLRYSVWIPIYPLGFTCEAIVIWLSLTHFDNSDDLSLPLPNPLNISFHPSIILRVGLFVVPFFAYNLISHMFAQRKKRLAKLKAA